MSSLGCLELYRAWFAIQHHLIFDEGSAQGAGVKTLMAKIALVVLLVGSANVHAQSEPQPKNDSQTEIAAAQLGHQHPQGTTHEHNVEHLLELLNIPEQVNKSAGEILKLYTVTLKPGNTNPTHKSIIEAYQQDATRIVSSVVGWQAMKASYINSYASRMSEQDVAQISDLLRSPVWQKFSVSQADAGTEILQKTKLVMETNMAAELAQLRTQLGDGLAAVQAKKNEAN